MGVAKGRRVGFGVFEGWGVRVLVELARIGVGVGLSAADDRVGEGCSGRAEGKLQASNMISSTAAISMVRKDLVIRISRRAARGVRMERYSHCTRYV